MHPGTRSIKTGLPISKNLSPSFMQTNSQGRFGIQDRLGSVSLWQPLPLYLNVWSVQRCVSTFLDSYAGGDERRSGPTQSVNIAVSRSVILDHQSLCKFS